MHKKEEDAAEKKLKTQHLTIKKAVESLVHSQQEKIEAFPKKTFKCLKLNDGSTYYG
jgi:hypothetical protein